MPRWVTEVSRNKYLYLLALPGLLFVIVFGYVPLSAHVLAFKDFTPSRGMWGSEWAGFDNFRFFFGAKDWYKVTFNTLRLNFLFIVFGIGIAVFMALFINEIRHSVVKRLTQSAILLPYFISWMVAAVMTYTIFNSSNGLANSWIKALGGNPISWYQAPEYWLYILPVLYVWKFTGFNSVIFLATIAGISEDLYESSKIDGASRFQQMRYITLPLLRPTIAVMTLLAIGRIFYGDFGMIYGIVGDNGMLFSTTDIIDTYSYRALRNMGNFSMSSAVVLYQSLMGLIVVIAFNWMARKVEPDAKLF